MGLVGVKCPIQKKNVSFIDCITCKGCKEMGADNDEFPLLLRKKFLFQMYPNKDIPKMLSVTKITGCLRKHYYEMTEDWYAEPSFFMAVNIGTALHNHMGDVWDINEHKIYWETPSGNSLIGQFDMLSVSNRILYDLKTTQFGKYKQDDNEPSGSDMMQLQIYATILKERYGVELDGLKLVYLGLGDKKNNEFDIPYVDMTQTINNHTDLLFAALKSKTAPAGTPRESWECGFCYWKESCPDSLK